jgi:PTS system glucitol/sorbitol-specific IIA component
LTPEAKFITRVTAIGDQVDEFMRHQILVLFEAGAPEELAVFSILHEPVLKGSNVEPGDVLWLGSADYRILAVGEVANQNLAALGHLVIKFNGLSDPELPGDVCVESRAAVKPSLGDEIRIVTNGGLKDVADREAGGT